MLMDHLERDTRTVHELMAALRELAAEPVTNPGDPADDLSTAEYLILTTEAAPGVPLASAAVPHLMRTYLRLRDRAIAAAMREGAGS